MIRQLWQIAPTGARSSQKGAPPTKKKREKAIFEAGGETVLMNRRDLRQKRETTSFVPVSKCFQQTKCWLIVLQFLNDIEQPQS